jgi:dienelactone hydrolase
MRRDRLSRDTSAQKSKEKSKCSQLRSIIRRMAKDITRRELGLAAIAASAIAQGGAQNMSNEQAIEGLDPVAWTLQQYANVPLRLTFRATNKQEAEAWQRELRAKLTELVGGFPERSPLTARTVSLKQFPGYSREQFVFESRPGVTVWGYLLLPSNAKKPCPAVVCVPGHGRGVDDIVGIDEQGRERTDKAGYQHDFAIQVAEHGLAAVAIEPMAFGHRRDPLTIKKGVKATACQPAAGSALLLRQTMIGWRVWDTMRTIDWIETRPELDKARVGCIGISGGGTCTQFTAALDTRIQAAFVSGYLNTFRDSIMSVEHCIDNYVPGILEWAENYDVASLVAPRYFFSEGGTRDPIFPVRATKGSFARVKRVYEVYGVPERAQQEIFDGVHEFHGREGLPFLAKALMEEG